MTRKEEEKISKFLSYVLRHKPETIGLKLDAYGWASIEELIRNSNEYGTLLNLEILSNIVQSDEKSRYSISENGKNIRANQGHSVEIDLNLPTSVPPLYLYHGTSIDRIESIKSKGILKGERHHVHLSTEIDTALSVGKRHGKPHFFVVNAKAMHNDGHKFYLSDNGVWLTDHVPSKYLN